MINLDKEAYPTDFQEAYYQQVLAQFSKTHHKKHKNGTSSTIRWQAGNPTLVMNGCRKLLGTAYSDFFPHKDENDNFKLLILLPPEQMKKLVTIITERLNQRLIPQTAVEKYDFQRLKAVYTEGKGLMGNYINQQKVSVSLLQYLNITVCPYCNRNFINSRDQLLGAQLDHFYNKKTFPFLAVSLYNLIPSCSTCNLAKGTKTFHINPFIAEEVITHPVTFNYLLKSINNLEVTLKTKPHRPDERDLKSEELTALKLQQAYAIHAQEVQNMIDGEKRYSSTYRKDLKQLLTYRHSDSTINCQMGLTDDDLDRLIFGSAIFKDDIKNTPLGKLTKDIYQNIKSGRKSKVNPKQDYPPKSP